MLESIISWIREIFEEYLQFWYKVRSYQEAIVLRNGKFNRKVGAGTRLKIPFFEEVLETLIIPTTIDLKQQTLVTKDGKTMTVRGMIKSQVNDVQKFLLESYDQTDVLADLTMGIIARLVMDSTELELKDPSYDINNKITIKARAAVKKFGIDVLQVTLIDLAPTRSYRLFTGSSSEFVNS